MKKNVWTWLPHSSEPVLAGQLEIQNEVGRFVYEKSYMDTDFANPLDPINLRFNKKPTGQSVLDYKGFPGVIVDATPAGYGADRLVAIAKRDLDAFDLLELGSPDGVGAIEVCSDIEKKLKWLPHSLEDLISRLHDLEEDAPSSRAIRRLDDDESTSAGGERPKVTIESEGKLWLAKLQDRGDTQHLPAREFVVMKMAESLGIDIPEIKLIREGHREIFLIERFDRIGSPKNPQRHLFASAHSVLRLPAVAVRGDSCRSYLVFADGMRKWVGKSDALQADLRELWMRMAFNALVGNHDDHPRNHGLINDGRGWRLSKAFDITPLQTFSKSLAMGITASGVTTCSIENLLLATRYFDVNLEEAATWLFEASKYISESWRSQMRQSGVSDSYLDNLAQAFSFSEEVASDISLVEHNVERVKEAHRYPRKRY